MFLHYENDEPIVTQIQEMSDSDAPKFRGSVNLVSDQKTKPGIM